MRYERRKIYHKKGMKTRKDNQQQYDRTARWLVERSKEALLSTFFNIEADSIEFIRQEPQQVVHIGSSDFPLRIRQNGREAIFLLELQTHWNWQKAQKMLYYYVIFQEKYQVPVIPCMLLFLKNSKATDLYEDERVKFQFDLTRLWELPAEKYIDTTLELLPFVPLMDGGLKCVDDIEHRIYNVPNKYGEVPTPGDIDNSNRLAGQRLGGGLGGTKERTHDRITRIRYHARRPKALP